MNILIGPMPTTVNIDGVEVPINSDFRVGIAFELLMFDRTISDTEKLIRTLDLYYDIWPENIQAAVEAAAIFYSGGKEEQGQKSVGGKKANQIYSYDYDDDYIYAAFLDQYGVDLQEVSMHWWKFRAMFRGLKEDNEIVKIMGYRAMEIDNKLSKEQQRFYKQMQERYKIPLAKSEQDKLAAVEQALLNGGQLNGLL